MGNITFRIARPEDAEELLAIYAPYVEKTAISFEYEAPGVEEFRRRIAHTLTTYPYIVAVERFEDAEADAGGAQSVDEATPHSVSGRLEANAECRPDRRSEHIIGYAYVGRLHARAAYDWSVETSIYVDQRARKHGLGRQLYERLEAILREMNILNVNACIAYPCTEENINDTSAANAGEHGTVNDPYLNTNSPDFHAHLGYQLVGRFHACAYKFDRWYDMIWMEKWIAPHPAKPAPMIPFPELPEAVVRKYIES